jgi:co-chaperonin GroES (HSP10)
MKIKPVGYQVLVRMEHVEKEIQEGALKGFELGTQKEMERVQHGHDVGVIEAFGPIAFKGYKDCNSPEDYGVKLGDKVEFRRYDGKEVACDPDLRIINDGHILLVIEEDE